MGHDVSCQSFVMDTNRDMFHARAAEVILRPRRSITLSYNISVSGHIIFSPAIVQGLLCFPNWNNITCTYLL